MSELVVIIEYLRDLKSHKRRHLTMPGNLGLLSE